MPQLVAFNRKWSVGSDDFVYPGVGEIMLRLTWVAVVSAIFNLHKDTFDCDGGNLLYTYYIGLLTLLVVSVVVTAGIIYISTRGTITNITPRKKLAKLLYLKLAISFVELGWNILGTYWVFGMSSGCEKHVVLTVKGVVIFGWAVGLVVLAGIGIVFDPLGALHKTRVSAEQSGGHHDVEITNSAKRVWETRCKFLCCCVGCDKQSNNAFSGIAEIFSNFFQGVDLVPTDIACGLILVHRDQERERYRLSSIRVEPPRTEDRQGADHTDADADNQYIQRSVTGSSVTCKPGTRPLPIPKPWMTIEKMAHYMKFAMASYGWPLYIFTHLMTGTCQLWSQCKCCACCMTSTEIQKDNCCRCNTASIRKTTGVHPDDIVYASFHNKIYEIPFFVSIDRHTDSVVVAVRGTLSLTDVITDLTAECDSLDVDGLQNCKAHRGILMAAKYVQSTLETLQILEQAFERAQGAKLVITGHSLGAGTAALLAVLLKPKYPDLICFAFSPPGGLMSLCGSQYCQEFICSVVLGKDIIPRLGIHTMEDLRTHLLQAIQDCDIPKYKLLASGVWQLICGLDESILKETNQSSNGPLLGTRSSSTSYGTGEQNLEPADGIRSAIYEAERHKERCKITFSNMYPPGQILQIVEKDKQPSWCGIPEYRAVWASVEDYSRVIVSPKMLSDHFPDAVMRALDQLKEREYIPTASVIHV